MKVKELRDKNKAELDEMKKKLSRDLLNARFKHSLGQLENKSILQKLRRDMARVNTILREKVS